MTLDELRARFAHIYARAIAKEQAEWEQMTRPRRHLNAAWGRDGQALKGSRKGAVKTTKSKGKAMGTRLPDRVDEGEDPA